MNDSNVKNLIILGNGFDIHCKLNSSFSDYISFLIHPFSDKLRKILLLKKYFYMPENKHKKILEYKSTEIHIKNVLNSIQNDYYNLSYINNRGLVKNDYTVEFMNDFSKETKNNKRNSLNFWTLYLCFLKNNEFLVNNAPWNDIETQISKLCNFINNYINTKSFKNKDNNKLSIFKVINKFLIGERNSHIRCMDVSKKSQLYTAVNSSLSIKDCFKSIFFDKYYSGNTYLIMTIIIAFKYCDCYQYFLRYQKNYSNYVQLFYNFLFDQLSKFEDKFAQYLKYDIEYANNKGFNDIRIRGLNRICNKPYNLITFNYTGNPEEKNCHSYLPIHSDINHRPIIGISDEDCVNKDTGKDKGFFEFSKIFKIMTLNENETINNLAKGINCIRFYGHSLALADYPYFKYIFDTCHIKNDDNKMKLYFYCTNYNHNPDFKVDQAKAIYRLMNQYSKSLKIKLILEGRLKIIPIDWK